MALAGQNSVRQFYLGLAYPGYTTVAALKAGANGDLALLSSNGTAIAAGKPFVFLHKSNKGIVVTSDTVKPSQMLYSRSRAFSAKVLGKYSATAITPVVGDLYTVEIAIKEMGSYSSEDEYIKKGFYKCITGNTAENIVDGLVQSLARNFSREEPDMSTFTTYTLAGGATIQIPENPYFLFAKDYSDAVAEVSTITVTAGATVAGNASVVLNGVTVQLPLSINTTAGNAAEIAATINTLATHTATVAGSVVTITAVAKGVQSDITGYSAGGATSSAATVAVSTQGVNGTAANATLLVLERNTWVDMTYVRGKMTRTYMSWTGNFKCTTAALPTTTFTASKPSINSGYDIADMEWYLKGERNDFMREMGYPYNFTNTYSADITNTYNTVELGYYEIGRDEAKQSKKSICIAMPVSQKTAMNTLITNLNTILGAGSINALP